MTPPTSNGRRTPPPTGIRVAALVLVLIPVVALMLVPTYTKQTPRLWGFPFFYWYQLMWLFLGTGCVVAAYYLLNRAGAGRGGSDEGSER